MITIEKRDGGRLLQIIEEKIKTGNTIYRDWGKVYNCLSKIDINISCRADVRGREKKGTIVWRKETLCRIPGSFYTFDGE